jgi:hypothetical protein
MSQDPIIIAANFLLRNLEWLRHHPGCDESLADIAAAARVVAGIARGPAEQQYLGPCGTTLVEDITAIGHDGGEGIRTFRETECDGDVYAPRGGSVGRCRACGAEVASEDRRAWLDAQARSHAFRAVHIADAYGINVNTIRSWATRGQLVPHGTETDMRTGKPVPLYNVGDVLTLAAADAARRAEQQAKRARRKENAA